MSLLKVENLVANLRQGVHIVDAISFDIASGETFALLGESGCGKSMTALALMRLLPDGVASTAGSIQLDGTELFDLPEHNMREIRGGKVAMIFQEPGLSLNPVMTVGEQIAEVLALHHRVKGDAARHQSIELLEQVGIPDAARRINEYPFQLSGGMKQRVMIAMALSGSPKLLIADEPTTALDVTIQAQVLSLLRDTQRRTGMSMLLITHDLGIVAENANRIGVMYAGQIIEHATRDSLFSQPLHPYTRKLLAALPDARRSGYALEAIPGNVPPLGSILRGCRFAERCDRAWGLCYEKSPDLHVVRESHGVRCHLYGERGGGASFTQEAGVASVSCETSPPMSHMQALLHVEDLKVHFPIRSGILQRTLGHVKAVDGVTLQIPRGHTLALVGESGCGKTTLGKALLNLIRPTGGIVQFDGLVLKRGEVARVAMQMVFQDPYASLNPKMRVAEIIEEGMSASNIGKDSSVRQEYIDGLLEKVGLERDSKWRYPHEFSGGQRQRIAIARALAVSPKMLICDEPTSALDVSVQAQILNLLGSLQQDMGLSYLFITHNLAVVEYLAHEVCVMYLGRIVERGRTEEVLHSPKHPYTQALLSAVPRIDGQGRDVIKLEGEMPSPADPPQGCHFAPRCTHASSRCMEVYPTATHFSVTHILHCHLYPATIS